ncbi:metal ABC transporter substrate-binding protein [Desulfotomaculum sp. 1211_IL3151]|uniref:metal ABC transporter substrate-binding protein n=1 Tax=Desulfotomaculum sp. 1211_IL3151 TaxID=3084055 RepID=UPI002FD94E78
MKRVILSMLALIFLVPVAIGCQTNGKNQPDQAEDTLKVYTSIYPLYDFAKQVGGTKVQVENIVPPGAEPHDWEPSPQDMVKMTKANVIILSGTGVEHWGDKILNTLDRENITIIQAGQRLNLIEETHAHTDSPEHHLHDPHVWLDPLHAKIMVDEILTGLVKADPNNKSYYQANANQFQQELDKLHLEYQENLAKTKTKEFITSHAAFGYLAKRYGLIEIPIRGLAAESEPSPADMAAIIELARNKNIDTIFFETLVNPKVSETLASELKAKTLVLNPIEGLSEQELASGENYLSVMRKNLANLKIALGAE